VNTCQHCGAEQVASYRNWFMCGSRSETPGITVRTSACGEREPLFEALQTAKARIERLISAGDVLCEIQEGHSGRAAIERWNEAKK
jgi:hypothetical protein